MPRRPRKETVRILLGSAVLLRSTTWRCGTVERKIIRYLQRAWKTGRGCAKVADMVRHFDLKGKPRVEFLDALERLKKRYIIEIEVIRSI